MPAIAGEGRALYDAAVAQGIAGIMARQRMSPYLPGIRSRLWRFVAATPGSAAPGPDVAADAADAGGAADAAELPPPTAAAPVLALISRLPLDDEG